MRKDCALSKLTEEQRADLFDWLTVGTYDAVLKRVAQPPPKGFGIKTHINSLFRFYQQYQAQIRAHDLANVAAADQGRASLSQRAADSNRLAPPSQDSGPRIQNCEHTQSSVLTSQTFSSKSAIPNPQSAIDNTRSFFTAASAAFAHSTYILAHSPLNPATYRAVARTLQQNEDSALKREFLDIARQQLALGRERLQLDRTQFEYNAARAALALLPELIAIDQLNNIDDEAKIWRVRDRLFGPSSISEMADEKCSMINSPPPGTQDSEPRTQSCPNPEPHV